MNTNLISVIIPAYNAEKYIKESLNSVLCQTYNNYEIIVINDGSTDSTRDIIENEFPMVKCIHVPNQGASAARNIGIRCAQGEYIAFLDADDLWMPDKLEKQISVFNSDLEVVLVFTESISFDDNGYRKKPFLKRDRLMKGNVVKNIFIYSYVGTPTVMVKKNIFENIGFFEEVLKIAEDDNMWLRIAMKFKIALVDEDLVQIRIRSNSLTTTSDNFFEGVNGHIELLKNKYPEIFNYLGDKCIKMKKSENYFIRGYVLFSEKQYQSAVKNFFKSFVFFPSFKSLIYIVFALIPNRLIDFLKIIKRRLKITTC